MTLTVASASPEIAGFVLSGLVVLYGWSRASGFRAWVDRHLLSPLARRFKGTWDWRVVAAVVGVVFVAAAFVQSAPIPCSAGEDDTLALLQSGRNFLSAGNPMVTYQCGQAIHVPYGIASILLCALGSFGGRVGIWLVWNLVALAMIPLAWALAGAHRRYATVFVATSMLYAPLVVGSIQGGHSSIVPVTALLGVWLALRKNPAAGVVGGVFSTVKFPSLFPFWGGLSGTGTERWRSLILSVVVFGGLSLLVGFIWGGYAYQLLFTQQLTRVDFSINEFGVLIPLNAVPPSAVLVAIQGVALLAGLALVHLRRWATVPAIALLTVVVVLVAQRFTQNFMIWILPVALLGPSYGPWLLALGAVGVLDSAVALPACSAAGGCGFSEGLAAVFGLLLLGLLVKILREFWTPSPPGAVPSRSATPTSATPATGASPSAAGAFQSGPRFESAERPDRSPWPGTRMTPPPSG